MRIYICVDDTDDVTKSTSTGKIAEYIARNLKSAGARIEKGISRHQLLIHEDIDYTSHNSSMCIVADVESLDVETIKSQTEEILKANMAEVADPGLCFCVAEELKGADELVAFGIRAQKEVIRKEEAYALAESIGGTILEEYGGTGAGVIGALAGVGLRMSGCDGTLRGGKGTEYDGMTFTADQWIDKIEALEQVLDFEGNAVSGDTPVTIDKQYKLTLVNDRATMIVKSTPGGHVACKKKDLYAGDSKVNKWNTDCPDFEQDNDVEECYNETENSCYNCLYRRWTTEGFKCVK